MKIILSILLLVSLNLHSQNICVSVDCKDTIRYPQVITLNGSTSSTDGIKARLWAITKGVAIISNPNVDTTFASAKSDGLYVFLLTGTSLKGAIGTAFDSVIYIANKPPAATCGPSYTDTTTTGVLTGSGTDPEGGSITYLWSQINGPNQAVITATTFQNPLISGLITGTYIFQLTVTDNGGLTSTATQTVYVALPVTVVKTVTTIVKTFSDGSTTTTVSTVP